MRWWWWVATLVCAGASAQDGARPHPALAGSMNSAEPRVEEAGLVLPESPGALLAGGQAIQVTQGGSSTQPCDKIPAAPGVSLPPADPASKVPCQRQRNPYRLFLDNTDPTPLTVRQKAYLAFHDVIDPFNLLTITANSAFTIGINSHTGYGPGMRGFGINVGDSLLQDATGEFIGTFGVCSLFHEDPRYHRLANASAIRRVGHAMEHTLVAQHDNGSRMINYENLITYPASAEISNLYVPGVHGNGPSTVARVVSGLATDPINNLITEFLPDVAKRVHIRVIFVQQIINQIAGGQTL